MPETIRGITTATWGVTAETGALMQSFEVDEKVDEQEVRDENGEVAVHIVYNRMKEVSGSFFVKADASGIAAIVAGGTYAYDGASEGSSAKIITSVKTARENQNLKRIDFTSKMYPLVT